MALPHTQYLKGFFPLLRGDRLTYDQTVKVLLNTNWSRESKENFITAVAVTRGESAGDPTAYLSYLSVPGTVEGVGSLWQQKVYKNNAAWLRKIPISHDTNKVSVPYLWELPELLATRKLSSKLAHRRITVKTTKAGRLRADCGLFQLNSQYYPIEWDADANAEIAHEIFLNRDRQFTAWMAYTGGHITKYIEPARVAVNKYWKGRPLAC